MPDTVLVHYPYKYCSGQSVPDTVSNIMHYPYKNCSGQSVPDTVSNIKHYPYKYCSRQSVADTKYNALPIKNIVADSLCLTQY